MPKSKRILTIADVMLRTTLSRSTVYRLMKQNRFPSSVSISEGRVGWYESDVDEYLDSRR